MTTATIAGPPRQLLAAADWPAIGADLDASGCAVTPASCPRRSAVTWAGLYDRPERFRSTIDGLDEQGADYTGGEFLLVEQRPRAQSRGTAAVLSQGHGLIFTTRDRPVRSARAGPPPRCATA